MVYLNTRSGGVPLDSRLTKRDTQHMERFNYSLQNNRRAVVAPLWNHGDKIWVRAHNILHPLEFKNHFAPTQHEFDWHNLTDDQLNGNIDYKMRDLEQSVLRHGVLRPVIAAQTKHNIGGIGLDRNLVLDGHHRAVAAMRQGVHIPVYIAAEPLISRMHPGEGVVKMDLGDPNKPQFDFKRNR
jgi:hypothetical protein